MARKRARGQMEDVAEEMPAQDGRARKQPAHREFAQKELGLDVSSDPAREALPEADAGASVRKADAHDGLALELPATSGREEPLEERPVEEVPSGSRSRIRRRIWVGVAIAVLLLVGAIASVQLALARQHLSAGASYLNRAISTVRSPSALNNSVARSGAIRELRLAKKEFAGARGDLFLWSSVLSTLGWVPHYGAQLTAASPAATSAYFATSSALDIVQGVSGLWPLLGHHTHHQPLMTRLATALIPGRQEFIQAVSDAGQGVNALQSLPTVTGNAALDRAAVKMHRDLPRLETAAKWLTVLPSMLGEGSTQRYLFCWENSEEIRAAGGFLGATDLITFHRGAMTKRFSGSALRHEIDFIELPPPEAELTNETVWLFRDSNFSPDFPTSARLERWFYARDTGVTVNGVVDFVDQGVPDILRATGPVRLPAYHVTVTADNAVELANRFASSNSVPFRGPHKFGKGGNLDTYRKQFLGYEFAAIVKRLQRLPVSRWGALATSMGTAIQHRDIMIWNANPGVEDVVRAAGADGSLSSPGGDYVHIVDDNRSYNKIGPYVHESASYNVDILPDLWLDSTLTIRYHLDRSPKNIEGRGPRFGQAGSKHDFRDFLRVYVPRGATVEAPSGLNLFTSNYAQQAYGLTQVSGWFQLSPTQNRTVTIHYQVPPNDFAFGNYKQYRLTISRQPGARLPGVSVSVRGTDGVRLATRSGSNQSFNRWIALPRDRSLVAGISGAGQPDLVPLAPAQYQDPFIPYRFLQGL